VLHPSGQLDLPLRASAADEEFLRGTRGPLAVRFVRHRRARRYVLRVDAQGVARVTMPRWGRRSEARAFAEAHITWIERERVRQLHREAAAPRLAPGTPVLLRGVPCPVAVHTNGATMHVAVADLTGELPVGTGLHRAVLAIVRRLAARELPHRLHVLAAQHGLAVSRVTIRDQRTRWGSCSPGGRISLNWRLVQMPEHVCDYVLIHELMHLRVRNHSARFWRHVAEACPGYEQARAWLRDHGGRLL
jgi:predicted metal-dependent hydrolase